MDDNGIFSTKVSAGRRTYFFDVRRSSQGARYLVLSESRRISGGATERNRVIVFEEHLPALHDAFDQAARAMKPE